MPRRTRLSNFGSPLNNLRQVPTSSSKPWPDSSVTAGVNCPAHAARADEAQYSLRVNTTKLPAHLQGDGARAYFDAYRKALNCPFLRDHYPGVRETMLDIFRSDTVTLKYLAYDPEYDAQCAYTYPTWVLNQNTIRLRPL